jgi:hypothetical protein
MRINKMGIAGVAVALFGIVSLIISFVFLAGCDNAPTAAEVGKKTGAALDTAADKTVEFTGKALEETGEGLQKAGTAVKNTGENMQK